MVKIALRQFPGTVAMSSPKHTPGIEIRGRPVVRENNFLGKDDHVLTDGSSLDAVIFALIIVLYEDGPLRFGRDYHVIQRSNQNNTKSR
jgi:hypothetical protein